VSSHVDVALIGGGIMSATLGTLIQQLEPTWKIAIYERLSDVALESSNPWNNAGTGHSAYCELNYTPEEPDGTITTTNAIKVAEQFQVSRQFWSYLVHQGVLPEPKQFIHPVPHMTFVWGEQNVDFLRRRHEALQVHPLFASMEFTDDPAVIHEWAPLLVLGRKKSEPIAATRIVGGTDVDFGAQTHELFAGLIKGGAKLHTEQRVTGLSRLKGGGWKIKLRNELGETPSVATATFVFVGAGGAALSLLQSSGIKEIRGYGGFPIAGEFLRTSDPEIVARHRAKVYGKAASGAPPMSVPHLDLRIVDGEASLMFGPYAGFSTKFLKNGSLLDLPASLRWHNIFVMLGVAFKNLGLVRYLVSQVLASRKTQDKALLEFAPDIDPSKFEKIVAGQRVQVMKKDPNGKATLQFGTEVVASADGTIAGLLGASPGASTAVPIMLDVIARCFPDQMAKWAPRLKQMVPSYGEHLAGDEPLIAATISSTTKALQLA